MVEYIYIFFRNTSTIIYANHYAAKKKKKKKKKQEGKNYDETTQHNGRINYNR